METKTHNRAYFYSTLFGTALIAWLMAVMSSSPLYAASQDIEELMARYEALLLKGRTYPAEQMVNKALKRKPHNPVLLSMKANLLILMDSLPDAERTCRAILKRHPNFEWPFLLLAKIHLFKGNYDKASDWLQKYHKKIKASHGSGKDAKLAEIYLLQGDIWRRLGRYKLANIQYTKALKLNKDRTDILELQSWNNWMRGEAKHAEDQLLAARKLDPANDRVLVALANHYKDRRYYGRSLHYLAEAVRLCKTKKRCEGLELLYNEEHFSKTGITGFSISPILIPLTFSCKDTVDSEITNLENIQRTLLDQNIGVTETGLHPVPKNNYRNTLTVQSTFFSESLPIVRLGFMNEQKFKKDDPLLPHKVNKLSVEMEKTMYWGFMGDATLFPYFDYVAQTGTTVDLRTSTQTVRSIKEYVVGLRTLIVPNPQTTSYILNYSYGFGDVSHHQVGLEGAFKLSDRHTLRVKMGGFFGRELTPPLETDRYTAGLGLDINLAQNSTFDIDLSTIYRRDDLSGGGKSSLFFWSPSLGIKHGLSNTLNVLATLGGSFSSAYSRYDNLYFTTGLLFSFSSVSIAKLAGGRLRQALPIEFGFGYRLNSFLGGVGNTLHSAYVFLNFFGN